MDNMGVKILNFIDKIKETGMYHKKDNFKDE